MHDERGLHVDRMQGALASLTARQGRSPYSMAT